MKIELFSTRADYEHTKPITFEVALPDNAHILDTNIVLGHKSAQLHLRVVRDAKDGLVPMKLLALLLGQEHDDVREYEFVQKVPTTKFTSVVPSYYLFTAPRE